MIEIEGLKKRFGQSIALDEVSMHVRDGAMYGFVGPNGAGKTTTIRCMMGLLGKWSLASISQWKTELFFCRSKMTGGHGKHPVRITAMNSHSPQTHGLTHGRTGAIKPKQGDLQTSGSERCSDQLTQQITGKQIPDI